NGSKPGYSPGWAQNRPGVAESREGDTGNTQVTPQPLRHIRRSYSVCRAGRIPSDFQDRLQSFVPHVEEFSPATDKNLQFSFCLAAHGFRGGFAENSPFLPNFRPM